jgi:hypothetical protein
MNPEPAAHARLDPAIALWMSFRLEGRSDAAG